MDRRRASDDLYPVDLISSIINKDRRKITCHFWGHEGGQGQRRGDEQWSTADRCSHTRPGKHFTRERNLTSNTYYARFNKYRNLNWWIDIRVKYCL